MKALNVATYFVTLIQNLDQDILSCMGTDLLPPRKQLHARPFLNRSHVFHARGINSTSSKWFLIKAAGSVACRTCSALLQLLHMIILD